MKKASYLIWIVKRKTRENVGRTNVECYRLFLTQRNHVCMQLTVKMFNNAKIFIFFSSWLSTVFHTFFAWFGWKSTMNSQNELDRPESYFNWSVCIVWSFVNEKKKPKPNHSMQTEFSVSRCSSFLLLFYLSPAPISIFHFFCGLEIEIQTTKWIKTQTKWR